MEREPHQIILEASLHMVMVALADPSRVTVQEASVHQAHQIPVTVATALEQVLQVMEIRHLDLTVVQAVQG